MWGLRKSDQRFFDAFSKHAEATAKAARALVELLEEPASGAEKAAAIKRLERDGDAIVRQTVSALRATWITPFDRGDILALISLLDDVLDLIHAVSDRVLLFEIQRPRPGAVALGGQIQKAADVIAAAMAKLPNLKHSEEILKQCESLNQIEKETDDLYRQALARLYQAGSDPLDVMKWREIYEKLEGAVDSAEDVGDAIEGVVLEYS